MVESQPKLSALLPKPNRIVSLDSADECLENALSELTSMMGSSFVENGNLSHIPPMPFSKDDLVQHDSQLYALPNKGHRRNHSIDSVINERFQPHLMNGQQFIECPDYGYLPDGRYLDPVYNGDGRNQDEMIYNGMRLCHQRSNSAHSRSLHPHNTECLDLNDDFDDDFPDNISEFRYAPAEGFYSEGLDTDSAFSDCLSLPNSGSHISVTTTSSQNSGSSTGSSGIGACTPGSDYSNHTKQEKMKLALEKITESNIRKLFVRVYTHDGSSKSVLVDEKMTVAQVCDMLVAKNYKNPNFSWSVVEQMTELHMERVLEDHDNLVENLLIWSRDTMNRLLFVERPEKFAVFIRPEEYLLPGVPESKLRTDCATRQSLIQEFFQEGSTRVPEMEGMLHLKCEGKKAWKKYYFVLRSSGVYYNLKGKGKASRDLLCLQQLDFADVYYGLGWKKKYKAPTDFCFALKHPKVQKKSKYISYLCADDARSLFQWVMAIRVAKHGRQLLVNFESVRNCINTWSEREVFPSPNATTPVQSRQPDVILHGPLQPYNDQTLRPKPKDHMSPSREPIYRTANKMNPVLPVTTEVTKQISAQIMDNIKQSPEHISRRRLSSSDILDALPKGRSSSEISQDLSGSIDSRLCSPRKVSEGSNLQNGVKSNRRMSDQSGVFIFPQGQSSPTRQKRNTSNHSDSNASDSSSISSVSTTNSIYMPPQTNFSESVDNNHENYLKSNMQNNSFELQSSTSINSLNDSSSSLHHNMFSSQSSLSYSQNTIARQNSTPQMTTPPTPPTPPTAIIPSILNPPVFPMVKESPSDENIMNEEPSTDSYFIPTPPPPPPPNFATPLNGSPTHQIKKESLSRRGSSAGELETSNIASPFHRRTGSIGANKMAPAPPKRNGNTKLSMYSESPESHDFLADLQSTLARKSSILSIKRSDSNASCKTDEASINIDNSISTNLPMPPKVAAKPAYCSPQKLLQRQMSQSQQEIEIDLPPPPPPMSESMYGSIPMDANEDDDFPPPPPPPEILTTQIPPPVAKKPPPPPPKRSSDTQLTFLANNPLS